MKAEVTPEEIKNARKYTCNVCGYYGIWTKDWGYYEKLVGTKYNLGEEQFNICSDECRNRAKKDGLIYKWRNKTFKDCCSEVAAKHKLGKSLVTGHKAVYWEEAAEMYASELKKENEQLKLQLIRLRPRRLIDED